MARHSEHNTTTAWTLGAFKVGSPGAWSVTTGSVANQWPNSQLKFACLLAPLSLFVEIRRSEVAARLPDAVERGS